MPVATLISAFIAALVGPGPDPLPHATVRVDSAERRLVIELPAVDLPAAAGAREAMVGLPLCQVLVPLSGSARCSSR